MQFILQKRNILLNETEILYIAETRSGADFALKNKFAIKTKTNKLEVVNNGVDEYDVYAGWIKNYKTLKNEYRILPYQSPDAFKVELTAEVRKRGLVG